jgi:WD40 repeat protein
MRFCWLIIFLVAMPDAFGQTPIKLEGHGNVVSSIRFTADGKRLVSGSWDRTVRVWDLATNQQPIILEGHTDWVHDVFVTPDTKSIFSTSQKSIRQWDMASATESEVFPGLGGATVNCAAFSPDGKLIVTGGRNGIVQVWKVGQSEPLVEIKGFASWVGTVAVSADSKVLAAGTRTGKIRIFDLPSGAERISINAFPNRQVLALEISPDGSTLASGGFSQTAILWDLKTGKQTAQLAGHRGVVTSVKWSNDGKLLATGERHGSVHIWNTNANNRQQQKITAHSDGRLGFSVTALAFSPDAKRLATGSYDKTIKLWPVTSE